jgi:hypothetical protein
VHLDDWQSNKSLVRSGKHLAHQVGQSPATLFIIRWKATASISSPSLTLIDCRYTRWLVVAICNEKANT